MQVLFYYFAFFLISTCDSIVAASIRMQPNISDVVGICESKSAPPRTAKTHSRLIKIDATVGCVSFCPMTWKVYATPHDIIPA